MAMNDISGLQGFIMVIITIAVTLAVGLIVLSEFNNSVTDSTSYTAFPNETITWVNNTYVSFIDSSCISGTGVCSALYNDTANTVVIETGNYSCNGDSLNFINDGTVVDITLGTADAYLNYNCKVANTVYTSNTSMIEKLSGVPVWIGIIIVVALAMLILGYFYNRTY